MIEKLNIKKNVITAVFAFTINIGLTFIGYKLLIKQGGLEALGIWSLLSAAIFVLRIGDIGLGGATERYIATVEVRKESLKVRQYFDTALTINTILFITLAIIGWIILTKNINLVLPENKNYENEVLKLLPYMFLVFVTSNIANVFNAGVRGLHLGYKSSYLSIFSNVVQMILVICLVPKIGFLGLALGQLFQSLVIIFFSWYLINNRVGEYSKLCWFPIYADISTFKILFGFSIKVQVVSFLNGIFEPLSKFLIGHTSGLTILGLYELAYKIVSLPRNAVVSGALSIIPAITNLLNNNKSEAKKLYIKSNIMVVKITLVLLILVFIVSPMISYIILNRFDFVLIGIIFILVLGFIGNVVGASAYTLGFSSGRLKGNLISSISVLFILLLGLLFDNYYDGHFLIFTAALGLFFGGIIVKKINEKIIL